MEDPQADPGEALKSGLFTAGIYLVLTALVFLYCLPREKADLCCPDGPSTKDQSKCGDGNGVLYANYRPKKEAKLATLFANLSSLSKALTTEVHWRRYLLVSYSATLLLFLITQRRFPNGIELLGSILTIYSILCVFQGFYRYHHYKFLQEAIESNLKLLKSRSKISPKTP